MRNTVAKRLRREAQQRTIGEPAYNMVTVQLNKFKPGLTQVLDDLCTRKVYKRLKQIYKGEQ